VAGVAAGFLETDLVANQTQLTDSNGVVHTPKFVDPNLLNPWGVGESATSPFWVSDNNNGTATLYNTAGMRFPLPPSSPLVVSFPLPGDPLDPVGAPTGLVSVSTQLQQAGAFKIGSPGVPAHFLFATEDGTIVGWAAGTHGIIRVDNSNNPIVGEGAVYKGLAIATDTGGTTRLYVTNFRAGTVEVYDTNFNPVVSPGAFTDLNLPRGYAPFNIVPIGGKLVVTYAVQDAAKHDDVAGESHGIVNTFDLSGGSPHRLIQHGQLNSPWGVAVAPSTFGPLAGSLLVGNFGNGHINAFNPGTGEFIDKMRDPHGQMLAIDGLWSLLFGNGGNGGDPHTLYFTAGPNGEKDGLFGALTPNP
jgi:uncharacterized protein (TIGR03118 family)